MRRCHAYKALHDDFAPSFEEWCPVIVPGLVSYVHVFVDECPIGLFIINVHSLVCWELHECFLPEVRGATAIAAALAFREWIWETSICQRLIGNIVESNKAALWFARRCGMKVFGVNKQSFMRDGQLQDQIMVGISRPNEGGA